MSELSPNERPIIIKRVKKAAHAHHGGAWKIAYADFVTAMMAFFLLLWLISMATPEQKEGLANYFAPPSISPSNSGSGGVMGGTAPDDSGAQMSGSASDATRVPATLAATEADAGVAPDAATVTAAAPGAPHVLAPATTMTFHSAAASIRQAWQAMPEITQLADNLIVEETVDGLDIQIVDQVGRPMFPEGSSEPYELTRQAVAAVAPVLQRLGNRVTISGHTAAGGIARLSTGPWELSGARANAIRAILGEFGLGDDRVHSIIGRAATEPFFPNDPYLAANERIRITVLTEPPPVPGGLAP